jgi:hypothetical protein
VPHVRGLFLQVPHVRGPLLAANVGLLRRIPNGVEQAFRPAFLTGKNMALATEVAELNGSQRVQLGKGSLGHW